MARGRKRQFEDNAARQRAYRERQTAGRVTEPARPAAVTMGFNFVTQPDERRTAQQSVTTFSLATPGRPSVPVAMMIAASTTQPQRARRDERPALDVPFVELSEPRETSVIVREVRHEL